MLGGDPYAVLGCNNDRRYPERVHNAGGYGSEFEYDSDAEKRKRRIPMSGFGLDRLREDLATKEPSRRSTAGIPSKTFVTQEYSKEEWKAQRFHFLALDAYARHKKLVNDYLLYYPGATKDLFTRSTANDKTDIDVIRENHRFLWSDEDDANETWAKKLAKKYWDKLFKEYCISDLSRYKENKIALRWQIEKEVVEGKGQFLCGNKRCSEREGLRSWEVNFAYVEHGEKKNALVKLRLCPECSYKLNYHHKRREVTRQPKKRRKTNEPSTSSKHHKAKKRKHKHRKHKKQKRYKEDSSSSSSSSSSEDEERPSGKDSNKGASSSSTNVSEGEFWSGPAPVTEEKSRVEEFEDYFQDMFL